MHQKIPLNHHIGSTFCVGDSMMCMKGLDVWGPVVVGVEGMSGRFGSWLKGYESSIGYGGGSGTQYYARQLWAPNIIIWRICLF